MIRSLINEINTLSKEIRELTTPISNIVEDLQGSQTSPDKREVTSTLENNNMVSAIRNMREAVSNLRVEVSRLDMEDPTPTIIQSAGRSR